MRFPNVVAVLAPVLFLLGAAPGQAQMNAEKPPVYTYVAEWSVPRAQWPDMAKAEQASTAVLDRLVSDGTLVAYGLDETVVHDFKGSTHSNWFQASSLAGIFKALDALQSGTAANAALYGSGPHQDELLVSRDYDGHSGNFRNAMLRGLSVRVKPGMERQFHDAFDRIIRPVLQNLVSQGALHGWSYQDQWIIKEPGRITAVIVANGAEGLDRYVAAINDLFDKNPDAVEPLIAATEPGSRRDFLVRVTAMRQK
ncbi:MAG TPA: hypothetical protein VKT29_15570 [Terriglobales bacterium]|nr:hypothetical protein [Terriglobales bacterium]